MLATLVIGLREGLEAALIVGIIAAFLRQNGKSLRPMWLGVGLAVALSIAVGVALDLVERNLPQRAQEGMESIIGAVAIFFVTSMIVWMNHHARGMKKELEAEAAQALGQGSTYALAVMAFLAVLKEGFETSVFLLATFSAAQSAALAATGAVVGVLIAIGIGWGIYAGGVRINLSRFFRITGAFLILVAAGLTITALRTAHEAGWLNAGQQGTVRLGWLVAPGTVQSALVTGVLGIPVDPRLVEVVGWLAYLIPVALFVYWPVRHRPRGAAATRLKLAIVGALAVAAIVLVIAVPGPRGPGSAGLVAADGEPVIGTAQVSGDTLIVQLAGAAATTVPLPAADARAEQHAGAVAQAWTITTQSTPADQPTTLTLDQVITLAGGRLPVGISASKDPGPFTATWSTHLTTNAWVVGDVLLDATQRSVTTVTLADGGLATPRTVTADGLTTGWRVAADSVAAATAAVTHLETDRAEHTLWGVDVPSVLGLAALATAATLLRRRGPVLSVPEKSVPEKSAPQKAATADS